MRAMLQIPAAGSDWHQDLALAFRSAESLLSFLELPPPFPKTDTHPPFPLLVTRHFANQMQKGNPADPLFLQVWQDPRENLQMPGFSTDPVGESCASKAEGILQKYQGRILVMPTAACAIHCRHCFRRAFPYEQLQTQGLPERLRKFLHEEPDIQEVILSGGDPLLLEDQSLARIFSVVQAFPMVHRLRIHTRLPVVLPSRFTQSLLDLLGSAAPSVVLVVHCNHPQELEEQSASVFAALRDRGVHLLNQSVLLAGVNDSVAALESLSTQLFAQGVLPYYLHQLDRVTGAAHFEVPEERGKALLGTLAERLPGYLVPRYVREIAGASGKTPL